MTKSITEELSSIFGQPVGNVKFTLEVQSDLTGYSTDAFYVHGMPDIRLSFTCMKPIPEFDLGERMKGVILISSERDDCTLEYTYMAVLIRGKNSKRVGKGIVNLLSTG